MHKNLKTTWYCGKVFSHLAIRAFKYWDSVFLFGHKGLNSAPDEEWWLTSYPSYFTPGKGIPGIH